MSTPNPSPPPNRQNPSYERILAAAQVLFLTQGFPSTSMDGIARQANVVRATVYNNFSDKQAILDALVRRYVEGYVAIPERLRLVDRSGQTSFELIEALINEAFLWRLSNAELRPLIDISKHLPNSGWGEANAAADDAIREWLHEIHRRDAVKGLLRDDLDHEFATTALYGMIETALSSFDVNSTPARVDEVVRQLTLLHWYALYRIEPRQAAAG